MESLETKSVTSPSILHRVLAIPLFLASTIVVLVGVLKSLTALALLLSKTTAYDLGYQMTSFVMFILLIWIGVWIARFGIRLFTGSYVTEGVPNFVVWNGHGYMVPLTIPLALLVTHFIVDLFWGKGGVS